LRLSIVLSHCGVRCGSWLGRSGLARGLRPAEFALSAASAAPACRWYGASEGSEFEKKTGTARSFPAQPHARKAPAWPERAGRLSPDTETVSGLRRPGSSPEHSGNVPIDWKGPGSAATDRLWGHGAACRTFFPRVGRAAIFVAGLVRIGALG
jgi:hypothetical protein